MSWYNPFSWFTPSTNPSDYNAPLAHGAQIDDLIKRGVVRAEGQAAPQLATGPQDQFRAMQMQQAQQLQNIASGQQKGAGELAVERQAQQALAGQQALAQMRGAGGAGQLAAARQAAAIGSTAAGQGHQAALQDQANAQQLLAGVTGQGRGADIGIAGQNANLTQQQNQLNTAAYQDYIKSLLGMDQTQLQGQVAAMNAAAQQAASKRQLLGGILGTVGQVGGAGILKSDERLKTEIARGDDDIDALLDSLRPYRYRYRDEARYGVGPRLGIMAQDLERSDAGRLTVVDEPDGKGVDVNRALSAALASAARLNERLRKLEHAANVQDVRPTDAPPAARVIAIGAR